MQGDKFVWDDEKYEANFVKHGVLFEEAASVFDDVNALFSDDEEHSEHEARFKIIGFSERARLLMVCHCYRNGDSIIRLISARKATKSEQLEYRR
ncbi:MAG: BrnT family toxin [Defluviitaleaceae bacterium]|nr:BrnT family toxin [Defluviitaleaceae bacterium]